MSDLLEPGTKFTERYRTDVWDDEPDEYREIHWTVGGYIYYMEDLYYTCVNQDGEEEDIHESDAKQYLKETRDRRG